MSFPPRLFEPLVPVQPLQQGARRRGVLNPSRLWPVVSASPLRLRVRFFGGAELQHQLVLECCAEWAKYAAIQFEESQEIKAEIRIGFDQNKGNWSYTGTESIDPRIVKYQEPSMNLATLKRGTILHELGHALGFLHEHQHPNAPIVWNEEQVLRDLMGPPNYWKASQIRWNVLYQYSSDYVETTPFDPLSIMVYEIPERWLIKGEPIAANTQLSDGDKLMAEAAYKVIEV